MKKTARAGRILTEAGLLADVSRVFFSKSASLWGGVQSQTEDTLTAMGAMRCFKRRALPGPPAEAGPVSCTILPYLRYYRTYATTVLTLIRIYATCCLVLSGMPCTGCATCGGLPPLVFKYSSILVF